MANVSIGQTLLDRGITRLLIEDCREQVPSTRPPTSKLNWSRAWRSRRPAAVAGADVRIASNASAEQWVAWTIDPDRAAQESDRPSAQSTDRLLRVGGDRHRARGRPTHAHR